MGFWGSFLSSFKQIALTVALDTVALLMSGGGSKSPQGGLKDKAFRSEAYGTPWTRCRGVVRLQGKDLWGTKIYTSWWKTVSGGLFGIGSTSVRYPKYSASRFIGFGKKLNGGAAISFLRIWADGKLLFNKQASTGNITGSVVVTTVGGGQLPGSQLLQIDLASGASVTINAGDLIIVPADPQPYTAQTTITATGPTTISVVIWPPLRVNLAGGGQVTIPPVSSSPYDLSSFDPNPHDGSHFNGGFNAPPGGVRFYLGSDTQLQDPLMVKYLGIDNVPGYRGTPATMIHDLQLANYGDHFPAITAEIAFDVAAPLYPMVGPIDSTPIIIASLLDEFIALPFSGMGSSNFINPLTPMPYVWVFSQVGQDVTHDGTIYRVNTQTNQYEQSVVVPRIGTFRLTPAGMVADADGNLYFIQNNLVLTKMDGLSLSVVNTWSGFAGAVRTIYPFDTLQSLFGNSILLKLAFIAGYVFDRNVLLRLGTPNPVSTELVVVYYDKNGSPIITFGDPIQPGLDPANVCITDDTHNNVYFCQSATLYKVDCNFNSSIVLDTNNIPQPVLALPTFSSNSVDVSSLTGGSSFQSIQYYSGDESIVVFGNGKIGKVDIATLAITQTMTSTGTGARKLGQADVMGTIVVAGGASPARVDMSTLQVLSTYNFANFFPGGTGIPGYPVFDPVTDSVWLDAQNNGVTYGGLNRLFLDRGNGNGIGLDSIVSSLMLSAGYSSGQFDVTQLTASGKTCYGVECDRESYLDSLRKLMSLYTFDAAEIDGKIVFVPRGNASIVTIPEDDLGALDDPSNYEPRVFEMLEDERDVPAKVTIKYYDPLKDSQQATQEFKRTLASYPSSLSAAKVDTASRQELDIVSPITEFATPVKQLAEILQWDAVASRFSRKWKLGWKYIRLDPTDVVTLDYKGMLLETRLTECDFGSGFAREMQGVSQDISAYTSTAVASPGVGSGGGTGGTPAPTPTPAPLSYTVSPTFALSQASPTEIDMLQVTVTWSDGRKAIYSARAGGSGFAVSDPGVGNSQLYFVTIYDPNRTGEIPGTPSLTDYCDITPNSVFLGQVGYIFIGTITITHDLVSVIVTGGGSASIIQATGFYVNGSGGGLPVNTTVYSNLDDQTGWVGPNTGANIGPYYPGTTQALAQHVSKGGHSGCLKLSLLGVSGHFSDVLWKKRSPLPSPRPYGNVRLAGQIYVDSNISGCQRIEIDTIIAKSGWKSNMSSQIDPATGALDISDPSNPGTWISTGIVLGALPQNSWNTYLWEYLWNDVAHTHAFVAFTLNGTRHVISSGARTAIRAVWADGVLLQMQLDCDASATAFDTWNDGITYSFS